MIYTFYILLVVQKLSSTLCARVQYRRQPAAVEDTPVAKQAALLHSLLSELNNMQTTSNANQLKEGVRESEKQHQEKLLMLLKKNYEAHRQFGEQAKSVVRTAHISNPEIIAMYRPQPHQKLSPALSDEDYSSVEPELPNLKNLLRNVRREIDDTDIKRRYLSQMKRSFGQNIGMEKKSNVAALEKKENNLTKKNVAETIINWKQKKENANVGQTIGWKEKNIQNLSDKNFHKHDIYEDVKTNKHPQNYNYDDTKEIKNDRPKEVLNNKKDIYNEVETFTKRTTRWDSAVYKSNNEPAQTTRRDSFSYHRPQEESAKYGKPFAGTPMQMIERAGIYEDDK